VPPRFAPCTVCVVAFLDGLPMRQLRFILKSLFVLQIALKLRNLR
jgi:hypothetical protein